MPWRPWEASDAGAAPDYTTPPAAPDYTDKWHVHDEVVCDESYKNLIRFMYDDVWIMTLGSL